MNEEDIVTNCVCQDEIFARRTLPYLSSELFDEEPNRVIFDVVKSYWGNYSALPPLQALQIEIARSPLPDHILQASLDASGNIFSQQPAFNADWLMRTAETWARAQAMKVAIRSAIEVVGDPDKHGQIEEAVRKARALSFDSHIGHDYIADADARYEYYTSKTNRVPLFLRSFNEATCGGFAWKTLNIFQAGPNVGKTFIMTNFAAEHLRAGFNVLYITMEIAEMEIARRIDANLLGIPIETLNRGDIRKAFFDERVGRVNLAKPGRLKIREYPTKGASVREFEALLQELALREGFVPDIIYVDYIGICSSATVRDASNSYNYIGAITAELRGLAVRHSVPVVSAVQFNRDGYKGGVVEGENDMSKVADSFAIAYNADAMYSLRIMPEAPEILRVGHAKSRYMRPSAMPYWTCGIDYEYMRLFDMGENREVIAPSDVFLPDDSFVMPGILEVA